MRAYNMGITSLMLLGFILTFCLFELILISQTEKNASEEEESDKSKSEVNDDDDVRFYQYLYYSMIFKVLYIDF